MYSITGFFSYNVQPSDLIVASPPTEAATTVTTTVATTAAATEAPVVPVKKANGNTRREAKEDDKDTPPVEDDKDTPPVTKGTRVSKMEGTWHRLQGCGIMWVWSSMGGVQPPLTFHKAGNSEGVLIWLISTSKTLCG